MDEGVGYSKGFQEARARQIFQMELEFVQCLSNPDYLQWLAKNRYFDQPSFINYLNYLQYWKNPEYALHVQFPQCLRLLDALQDPEFRLQLNSNDAIIELKRQQSHQWVRPMDACQPVSSEPLSHLCFTDLF
ncbi:putative mediator of RNA polymerase II transcription subunit 31 [Condylostylus longicornis]|uniref:putative mediator of RNA polymerase II transcription subunit 31 n=1 Tax=Condylostylus longicornis TaxID=2530218 RepID=UPI00244E25F9|nr:putative mediator of RNA polymerase II transcription subunit 31 [Condylostylus longicornis]